MLRFTLLYLVFMSVSCHLTFANKAKVYNNKDINTNFLKLYEKLDYLDEKCSSCDIIPSSGNDKVDVEEIKKNIAHMMSSIEKLEQKNEKTDEKLNTCANKNDLNQVISQCKTTCGPKSEAMIKRPNPCAPNPCLNGGRCEDTGNDYKCTHCPRTTSGKNCEALNCGKANKCFQGNGLKYTVYEERITFEQSKRKCESEGMKMVMPKEKESTEFVIGQLREIYGANNAKVRFWFGLKYYPTGFKWLDGSALGNYVGGRANLKTYTFSSCGIHHLHGGSLMWYLDGCEETAYTICEKQI